SHIFACTIGSYSQPISLPKIQWTHLTNRKKVADILRGGGGWENVDRTAMMCPVCSNTKDFSCRCRSGAQTSR
ncbi:hypothetical protein ACHAWF_017863, partial [Thalassiosira exigua]